MKDGISKQGKRNSSFRFYKYKINFSNLKINISSDLFFIILGSGWKLFGSVLEVFGRCWGMFWGVFWDMFG